jgi:hypothetical protein
LHHHEIRLDHVERLVQVFDLEFFEISSNQYNIGSSLSTIIYLIDLHICDIALTVLPEHALVCLSFQSKVRY